MGTFNRRSSTSDESYVKKRLSLQQLPVLNENGESFLDSSTNKRAVMNSKSLSLSLGSSNKQLNRRSSRNFEDWRNSTPSNNSSNRSSFSLVPFTPTRVNFSRYDDANPHQRRQLFIAHLPFSALPPLFRSRQLVRGILRVNKRNRSDAYVSCDELDGSDIYICGSRGRNRALEGDVVAVRLVNVEKVLREKQEKEDAKLARNNGQPKVRLPDEEDENEIIFGGDEETDVVKPKYAGVVVAILERAQNQVFSGTLTLSRPNNKRAQLQEEEGDRGKKEAPRIVWFKATDKRVPLIAIPIEQAPQDFVENTDAYENRLFVGSIKRWPITSLHPFGTLEAELGSIMDMNVQVKAILADANVSDTPFTEAVMQCVPPISYQPTEEENRRDLTTESHSRMITIDPIGSNLLEDGLSVVRLEAVMQCVPPISYQPTEEENRRDLTTESHSRMITIDPIGSNLLEDGLSVVRLGDDTFEVGVHICDISHFIKPHSPLDKEARARGVRVELDQKQVPMLPDELVDAVNFTVNELRPAISVIWKLSSDGTLLDTWFGKTIVKSAAQLSYEDVQKIVDGSESHGTEIDSDVQLLHKLASRLYEARQQQQWSLSDDEYEEEELLTNYPEKSQSTASVQTEAMNTKEFEEITRAATNAGLVGTPKKSASKRASIISSRLSASTGYSSEQSSQTIKALDKIRVMLTIQMVRAPPSIRVFAANPYA
ncbi:Putative SSD1 [Rhizopus microsporus]|nr:Putative SSD1 [Rhizopus microsporus]